MSARTGIAEHTLFSFSHVNKEFGAHGFYGPSPSKEWTNQTLVAFENRHSGRLVGKTVVRGYYRTHGDRFLYDIRSPGLFESNHRTHAVGVSAKTQHRATARRPDHVGRRSWGRLDFLEHSWTDHAFSRTSLFGELQWIFSKTLTVYPGLRFDYYSNFGASASPSLSGSWWVTAAHSAAVVRGRAFRIPSFTELYYRDPNHEANSSLKPESSWSAEVGTDFMPAKNWLGSLTVFCAQGTECDRLGSRVCRQKNGAPRIFEICRPTAPRSVSSGH